MVLAKMKNEDSRGLRRLYKGRNYVPKFQDILNISKHLKKGEETDISAYNALTSAQSHRMRRPSA
jgi:hypothetical protein